MSETLGGGAKQLPERTADARELNPAYYRIEIKVRYVKILLQMFFVNWRYLRLGRLHRDGCWMLTVAIELTLQDVASFRFLPYKAIKLKNANDVTVGRDAAPRQAPTMRMWLHLLRLQEYHSGILAGLMLSCLLGPANGCGGFFVKAGNEE